MKFDLYTKIVLTVIALALLGNVVEGYPPRAEAKQLQPTLIHFEQEYTHSSLARNRTFRRAVERVVERCSVYDESISC